MARSRNKDYKQGDRINIYLSRDVSEEFLDWINTQSDLSNFFLYAALSLYEKTGFIDVSEVMPRKINFNLSSAEPSPAVTLKPKTEKTVEPERTPSLPVAKKEAFEEESLEGIDESEEKKKNESWANLDILDNDPFA